MIELSENSRISLIEMSKLVNLSINAVTYKIKKMEKEKLVVAYKLLLNFKKLGYEYYKIDMDLEDLFPRQIRTYHYYKAIKIYKFKYFPEI